MLFEDADVLVAMKPAGLKLRGKPSPVGSVVPEDLRQRDLEAALRLAPSDETLVELRRALEAR